jgi:hypothetical protein
MKLLQANCGENRLCVETENVRVQCYYDKDGNIKTEARELIDDSESIHAILETLIRDTPMKRLIDGLISKINFAFGGPIVLCIAIWVDLANKQHSLPTTVNGIIAWSVFLLLWGTSHWPIVRKRVRRMCTVMHLTTSLLGSGEYLNKNNLLKESYLSVWSGLAALTYLLLSVLLLGYWLYIFMGLTLTLVCLGVITYLLLEVASRTKNKFLICLGQIFQKINYAKPSHREIRLALKVAKAIKEKDPKLDQRASAQQFGLLAMVAYAARQ